MTLCSAITGSGAQCGNEAVIEGKCVTHYWAKPKKDLAAPCLCGAKTFLRCVWCKKISCQYCSKYVYEPVKGSKHRLCSDCVESLEQAFWGVLETKRGDLIDRKK